MSEPRRDRSITARTCSRVGTALSFQDYSPNLVSIEKGWRSELFEKEVLDAARYCSNSSIVAPR